MACRRPWSVMALLRFEYLLALALLLGNMKASAWMYNRQIPRKFEHRPTLLEQSSSSKGPFLAPNVACSDGSCHVTSVKPDVMLLKICEYEIRNFCVQRSIHSVLECLIKAVADPKNYILSACRKETQVQQWMLSKDFLKGPQEHPACTKDIHQLCFNQDREGDSERRTRYVTACLEKHLANQRLSDNCEAFMMVYMREGSLNYTKDRPFAFECETEIHRHCEHAIPKSMSDDHRSGQVMECLKMKFLAHFLSDPVCSEKVMVSLQASNIEIRTDPLLYSACFSDVRMFCSKVLPGGGRQVACLLQKMDSRFKMQLQCLHMLRRRLSMWKFGAMLSPMRFPEYTVRRSASHFLFVHLNYILAAGAFLLTFLFALGLMLVIARKRRMRMRKNIHYIQIEQAK